MSHSLTRIPAIILGTVVLIMGMDAGEVERLDPPSIPGKPVIVVLKLNAKQRQLIRADAKVQIISEGMIGGKIVQINPGSAQAAPAEENALLESLPSTSLAEL